jgi:hypothetical protein
MQIFYVNEIVIYAEVNGHMTVRRSF